MIDREHPLSLVRQARLLEISRGSVYYQPHPTNEVDLTLMRRIDELHLEHPFMGARMMRRQLQRQGIHVGLRHLSTLMGRMGIQELCPQPGTSKRRSQHKIYPYLLRKVAIRRSNQVWALDTASFQPARSLSISWGKTVQISGATSIDSAPMPAQAQVLPHATAITLRPLNAGSMRMRPSVYCKLTCSERDACVNTAGGHTPT